MAKKQQVEFSSLIGKTLGYYGCEKGQFKLGETIWEAIEDEDDGYRSRLHGVFVAKAPYDAWPRSPLCKVRVEHVEREKPRTSSDALVNVDDGYQLVEITTGKVVLVTGTDNEDDYYPSFVFSALNYEEIRAMLRVEKKSKDRMTFQQLIGMPISKVEKNGESGVILHFGDMLSVHLDAFVDDGDGKGVIKMSLVREVTKTVTEKVGTTLTID